MFSYISVFLIFLFFYFVSIKSERTCTSDGAASDSNKTCSSLGPVQFTAFKVGQHDSGIKIELDEESCGKFSEAELLVGSFFSDICSLQSPCNMFSDAGQHLLSCSDIEENGMVLIVPKNRIFMWPTVEVGRIKSVSHIKTPLEPKPIQLETLSLSPKVFLVHNLFSNEEADALVESALTIKGEENRLKRSSTGVGYNIDRKRTSENAFDSQSDVAKTLQKRIVDLLAFPVYKNSWLDGFQILRYNLTTAYNFHTDAFDWTSGEDREGHNYDTISGKGSNRYATLLLYLSDVPSGGETVFPKGRPYGLPENETLISEEEGLFRLRSQGLTKLFEEGSWEENMLVACNYRLAVKPEKGKAVLFYSQDPFGHLDENSLHGGCPVLEGTKWAANLWLWNGPMSGYTKTLANGTQIDTTDFQESVMVHFVNYDIMNAQLYWEDSFFGELGIGESLGSNTYCGHNWFVRVDNQKPEIHKIMIPFEPEFYDGHEFLEIQIYEDNIRFVPSNYDEPEY